MKTKISITYRQKIEELYTKVRTIRRESDIQHLVELLTEVILMIDHSVLDNVTEWQFVKDENLVEKDK